MNSTARNQHGEHGRPMPRRFRRLLETENEDPLAGVANLFDIALVFVVALLIALFVRLPLASNERSDASTSANSQAESVPTEGQSLARYQIGNRQAGGKGKRLGIAYQLDNGEVIYVPQSPTN